MTSLSAEDNKLVVLARATRTRAGAAEGAALRDLDGRTYAAATVDLPSLQVSAVGVAVGMAVASGAKGLEAVVVLTESELSPAISRSSATSPEPGSPCSGARRPERSRRPAPPDRAPGLRGWQDQEWRTCAYGCSHQLVGGASDFVRDRAARRGGSPSPEVVRRRAHRCAGAPREAHVQPVPPARRGRQRRAGRLGARWRDQRRPGGPHGRRAGDVHLRGPRRRHPAPRPDPVRGPAAAHDHPRRGRHRARHRVHVVPQRAAARVGPRDGHLHRCRRGGHGHGGQRARRAVRDLPQLLRLAGLRDPAAHRARAGQVPRRPAARPVRRHRGPAGRDRDRHRHR